MPIPGQVTDLAAVQAQDVKIPSGGDQLDGYLARPSRAGTYPAVIVIHEAFGLVEHIRDLCRRFANAGFIAAAPDLYTRTGGPNPDDMQSVFPKMFGLSDAQVVRDLEATAAFLRGQEGANGKVGCIGFCSGGRQTLLFACSSSQVDAAVDCWGGFTTRATPNDTTTPERPTPVMDLVPQLRCPLFAVYGETDQNPPPSEAEELRRRAQQSGQPVEIKVFPNVGHAFLADYRPSYNEAAANELWPQVISFFEKHLR
ncbi:MAG TPA: dienelactone hydrolase family protein [Dehalococcoidia bacterium]|nr:dienelactone hydrolase family protein [Dehalococcoidia bacterium]